MEFRHRDLGQALRVELLGRLDSVGVQQVELPLIATIKASRAQVLLDLTGTTFVGSLGIRLLISAQKVLKQSGRQMVLFGAQPQVAEVFEFVALGDLMRIAGSESEALATL